MLTLSLWKKADPNLDFNFIGNKISDGSDGEVFELNGYSDRVIKVSAIFDLWEDFTITAKYIHLSKILDIIYLQMSGTHICARVYEHDIIGEYDRDWLVNGQSIKQKYILHYSILERCFKLSEDEKKVFHTIVSHEDRGLEKNFSPDKLKEILFGLSQGLDFDEKKVTFFYESLRTSPIKHLDLHPRNIMKNNNGDFKLIDFDRLELKNET